MATISIVCGYVWLSKMADNMITDYRWTPIIQEKNPKRPRTIATNESVHFRSSHVQQALKLRVDHESQSYTGLESVTKNQSLVSNTLVDLLPLNIDIQCSKWLGLQPF